MKPLVSINPSNGKEVGRYNQMSSDEISSCLKQVQSAYNHWEEIPIKNRADCFRKASEILRNNKNEYGRLMALEMGKPLAQGKAESEKCAWVCEYYAENAEAFLQPKAIETDASKSYVAYRPIGAVLAVMPWNFPFWQVFRFAAPTLMAGNVGVLKHASNVQGCALAIEKIFLDAGFPEHAFRSLTINASAVKEVIENPIIKAVTLTGSTPAGQSVAALSGAALKKTVLELGGSDPYVILEDADLDKAVIACKTGRYLNTGQSCIAAKRFIVVESVLSSFREKLLESVKTLKWGDPIEEDVDLGPMVNWSARDELHQQVTESIKMGARLLVGGEIPDNPGAFYQATVMDNVKPGMPAFDDELFGPVSSIISAKNEDEAITLANQTLFGLGSAVFTEDIKKGERIAAEKLESGACFVNDFVKSDPRLPFGGIKASGYGRELSSVGIHEFVNVKTVYIK